MFARGYNCVIIMYVYMYIGMYVLQEGITIIGCCQGYQRVVTTSSVGVVYPWSVTLTT